MNLTGMFRCAVGHYIQPGTLVVLLLVPVGYRVCKSGVFGRSSAGTVLLARHTRRVASDMGMRSRHLQCLAGMVPALRLYMVQSASHLALCV